MNRREFVRYCSVGAIAAGAGAFSYSWLNMKEEYAMRTAYSPNNMTGTEGLNEDEARLIYLAALAPSGHNTQPWVIRIKEPKLW